MPDVKDVRLDDIAHHLAMVNRFGGACPKPYSVAQHAVHVAELVLELSGDPAWALAALHHDSAEAYIGDQRRPIKSHLWYASTPKQSFRKVKEFRVDSFQNLEQTVLLAILQAFGLKLPKGDQAQMINDVDDALLCAEMRTFFNEQRSHWIDFERITPWSWKRARATFIRRHEALAAKIGSVRR